MSVIEEVQIKCKEVLEAFYMLHDYVPSHQFCTAKLLSAIAHISPYQPVEFSLPMKPALRGMLIVFPEFSLFGDYIAKHPHLSDLSNRPLDKSKGVGMILVSNSGCNSDNICWQRFTVVKEASHLFLDGIDLAEMTNVTMLSKSIVALTSPSGDSRDELFYRDYVGIIAALELLMPESIKPWMEHEVNVNNRTSYQIASSLRLPEKFVLIRMEDWGLI